MDNIINNHESIEMNDGIHHCGVRCSRSFPAALRCSKGAKITSRLKRIRQNQMPEACVEKNTNTR